MSSNTNKSNFLGMPHGTAAARLRKLLFFSLLKKHDENFCYRCGNEIIDASELTIDHKEPWEGVNIDLFWDLDNIAFSHQKCNRPHRRKGGGSKKRIFPPDGMAWCAEHRDYLPREKFDKGGRQDGLRDYCKECRKIYRKKWSGQIIFNGDVRLYRKTFTCEVNKASSSLAHHPNSN